MILEVAILNVKGGQEKQFEIDFAIAGKLISSIKGYVKHSLSKCVEQQNKYILLVDWENLEDHTIGFRQSTEYLEWKNFFCGWLASESRSFNLITPSPVRGLTRTTGQPRSSSKSVRSVFIPLSSAISIMVRATTQGTFRSAT
jgi:heme-degrading monooxygenase HmoA